MMTVSDSVFAFGRNVHNECECPAIAAGRDPQKDKDVFDVSIEYDSIVTAGQNKSVGIIDERQAKSAWLGAIRVFESHANHEQADVAKEIAEELGWCNGEDDV